MYSKVEMLSDIKSHRVALVESGIPIVECQPMLDRLIRTLEGPITVLDKGTPYTRRQSLELFNKTLQELDNA